MFTDEYTDFTRFVNSKIIGKIRQNTLQYLALTIEIFERIFYFLKSVNLIRYEVFDKVKKVSVNATFRILLENMFK